MKFISLAMLGLSYGMWNLVLLNLGPLNWEQSFSHWGTGGVPVTFLFPKDRILEMESLSQNLFSFLSLLMWSESESVSCSVVSDCNPKDYSLPGCSVHGDSPGNNTVVHYHSLLQGILTFKDQTWVSNTAGRFFIVWATREALSLLICIAKISNIYAILHSHQYVPSLYALFVRQCSSTEGHFAFYSV